MFENMKQLPNLLDTRQTSDYTIKMDNIEIYLFDVHFSGMETNKIALSTGFSYSENNKDSKDPNITSPHLTLGITNIGKYRTLLFMI